MQDAHYQDVLLCIGTNATIQEQDRFKMSGHEGTYRLKTEEEMRAVFPDMPEAADNTWKIAQMCELELEFGRTRIPTAQVPSGLNSEAYLEKLCREGLAERYAADAQAPLDRLVYELDHPLLPRRHGHRSAGAPAGLRALPEYRAQGDAGR
jgi:DNA polymerase-3 subunit alpha